MKKVAQFLPVIFILLFAVNCGEDSVDAGENNQNGLQNKEVTVQVNRNVTHQTIDGFGFFGARDVWWTGNHGIYLQ